MESETWNIIAVVVLVSLILYVLCCTNIPERMTNVLGCKFNGDATAGSDPSHYNPKIGEHYQRERINSVYNVDTGVAPGPSQEY
jgi:hypothetical protein